MTVMDNERRTIVITPPAPFVSLEEARQHLRVIHTEEDTLIVGMVAAATAHLDGPGGWLGRSLGVQTLETSMDRFECSIALPAGPAIALTSVVYLDGNGDEQTMDAEDYRLTGDRLTPAGATSWPSTDTVAAAVRIRYTAGYPNGVPASIRLAVLQMTAAMFADRETPPSVGGMTEMMLQPYRRMSI